MSKHKLNNLFNVLSLIILFLIAPSMAYGIKNNWVEVSKTPAGIQYLDRSRINEKEKNVIEISTKYLKIDTNNAKEIEENIYIMEINCFTHKFKDTSINGEKNLSAKWESSNGDKLINDVILESCKNV